MREVKDKYKGYDVTFLCPSESLSGEYRLTIEKDGKTLTGEYCLSIKGASGFVHRIDSGSNKEDNDLLNQCFEHFANTLFQSGNCAIKKAELIFRQQVEELSYWLFRVPEPRNPLGVYLIVVTSNGEDICVALEITQEKEGSRELEWAFERSISEKQFETCEKLLMGVVGVEFDSFFLSKDFSGAS